MIVSLIAAGLMGVTWSPIRGQSSFKAPDPIFVEFKLDDNPAEGAHQWVIAKVQYLDDGPGDGFWEDCENICNGNVHKNHKECTLACDDPCPEKIHCGCFEPEPNYSDNMSGLIDGLSKGAKTDSAPDYSDAIGGQIWKDIQGPLSGPKYEIHQSWPCWNNTPCSDSYRGYDTHWVTIRVTTQYSTAKAGGPRIAGATNTVDLVDVEVPNLESPYDGSYIDCLCENYHSIVAPKWQLIEQKYASGIRYSYDGIYKELIGTDYGKFDIGIKCPDMNSCILTARNPTPMPVDIALFPGTQLISSDPESQNMMVNKRIDLHIMPWGIGSTKVSIESPSEVEVFQQKEPVSATGNVVCINMKKHEPNDKVNYKPVEPRSTALRLLACSSAKERVTGPWVQTRTWIASDHSTFDEVRKILFPKPTEGIYLRALFEVGTRTHLDFTQEPLKRCLEPRLIVGSSASKKATDWFVKTMAKVDPMKFAAWISQNSASFAPLFASDAEQYAKKHAADVANALCFSQSPEIRTAGLEFLLHTVPEANRAEVASNGGLNGLCNLMTSGDDATISQSLEVAEAYRSKGSKFGLLNLSAMASASNKERAAKLASSIN